MPSDKFPPENLMGKGAEKVDLDKFKETELLRIRRLNNAQLLKLKTETETHLAQLAKSFSVAERSALSMDVKKFIEKTEEMFSITLKICKQEIQSRQLPPLKLG